MAAGVPRILDATTPYRSPQRACHTAANGDTAQTWTPVISHSRRSLCAAHGRALSWHCLHLSSTVRKNCVTAWHFCATPAALCLYRVRMDDVHCVDSVVPILFTGAHPAVHVVTYVLRYAFCRTHTHTPASSVLSAHTFPTHPCVTPPNYAHAHTAFAAHTHPATTRTRLPRSILFTVPLPCHTVRTLLLHAAHTTRATPRCAHCTHALRALCCGFYTPIPYYCPLPAALPARTNSPGEHMQATRFAAAALSRDIPTTFGVLNACCVTCHIKPTLPGHDRRAER